MQHYNGKCFWRVNKINWSCSCTKGPGLSNSINGIAYSSLDRSPLILFSDGFSDKLSSFVTHQVFDQKKLMSPFSKNYTNLQNENPEKRV